MIKNTFVHDARSSYLCMIDKTLTNNGDIIYFQFYGEQLRLTSCTS